jgi:iron(II)-dependent oxidoreductase
MGSDDGAPDEAPRQRVELPAFSIGLTEVTNAQFRRFLSQTGRPPPLTWQEAARRWGEEAPAVGVSWQDAEAYCAWAGLRLPSEAEWEKAARGPGGRKFPWGDRWDPERLVRDSSGPLPVGSRPSGASPYGCLDMAGNAWEWTSSYYEAYPGCPLASGHFGRKYRVLRGGCFQFSSPELFRAACRGQAMATVRFATNGFRVAADPGAGTRRPAGHPSFFPRMAAEGRP